MGITMIQITIHEGGFTSFSNTKMEWISLAKRKRDKEKARTHDGKTDHSGSPEAAEILAAG